MSARTWKRLVATLKRVHRDDEGATATEYAVMLALMIATCIGTVRIFGGSLQNLYVTIESTLFAA